MNAQPEQIREYHRKWRERNKDKVAAYGRAWRENNRLKIRESQRRWRAANPGRRRAEYERRASSMKEFYLHHHLKKSYGMTIEDLRGMLLKQDWKCGICKCNINERTRAIDHNHETGETRGLLCRNCNTAIGLLRDNPAICAAAGEYLAKAVGEPARGTRK